jgi:DNA-binding GntR family transcriptional regulator
MILARIQKLSVAIPENLAEMLEEEIIFGRLKSRERLTEEMVAARYGVSRSPVREALRLL